MHQAAKVGVSRFYHLRGACDPSRVVYTLADSDWWRMAVIAANGIGPLVCLAGGVAAFQWFWQHKRAQRGHLKLWLLWVAFHCCNAVFGALLADTFIKTGFWYVSDWLFRLGTALDVVLALLAGLAQVGLGYLAAVAFLQAHDSKTVMHYANRRLMVVSTLVVPWAAGGAFIALTKLPYFSAYEALHLLLMGLLVVPLAVGCFKEAFSSTVRRPQPTFIAWRLVGLAALVAIAWRLVLSPPVVFG